MHGNRVEQDLSDGCLSVNILWEISNNIIFNCGILFLMYFAIGKNYIKAKIHKYEHEKTLIKSITYTGDNEKSMKMQYKHQGNYFCLIILSLITTCFMSQNDK